MKYDCIGCFLDRNFGGWICFFLKKFLYDFSQVIIESFIALEDISFNQENSSIFFSFVTILEKSYPDKNLPVAL